MIKIECPRCNRVFQRMALHALACKKIPLHDELKKYMVENRPTISNMRIKWGVSQHFMEEHVAHANLTQYVGSRDRRKPTSQKSTGDSKCVACTVNIFLSPPPDLQKLGVTMIGNRCEWCHEKEFAAPPKSKYLKKLTEDEVVAIRDMRKNGHTHAEISMEFNISEKHSQKICTGATHKEIGGHIERAGERRADKLIGQTNDY